MAKKNSKTPKRRKGRPASETGGREPTTDDIRIRMYRQGLGDCFLLTFPRDGQRDFHMLIDCGVILGTQDAKDIMTRVVEDIHEATRGHVDVVVATHEHWDHLSGFVQAHDVFENLKIDQVWVAWTEDPADVLAQRLRRGHERTLTALRSAGQRLQGLTAGRPEGDRVHALAAHVNSLLEFFGAAAGQTTRDALDYLVHKRHEAAKVRYCRPGEAPIALPGVNGVRVFVLGPPHDETFIKRSNPTKTGKEVYEIAGQRLEPDTAFYAALGDGKDELAASCQPFDERLRLRSAAVKTHPFFAERYGAPADDWRRIDNDWLGVSERLALNLDSDTNNTSLALAFELEPGGRVLLFPGDAQVGNWLSWESCQWSADRPEDAPMTAADLLKRTVLYKVGHHASHNATLRAKGLELMTSPDLVALIPVNHAMAEKKRWFGMPFPALVARLKEKTQGRILRVDEGMPAKPDGVAPGAWKAFEERVEETELYFDYRVRFAAQQRNPQGSQTRPGAWQAVVAAPRSP